MGSAKSPQSAGPVLHWTAWHNSGAGYGLKVPLNDRAKFFSRATKQITLNIPFANGAQTVSVNVGKPSFWNPTCGELISVSIRDYLFQAGLAPWPKGHPPQITVVPVAPGSFRII